MNDQRSEILLPLALGVHSWLVCSGDPSSQVEQQFETPVLSEAKR